MEKKGKLSYPFSYFYKCMMDRMCPFCQRVDGIGISKHKEVVWCDYGTYLTKDACDTYASDGEGHCKYCSAGDFVSRQFPEELVMVCENCKKAINFDRQEVTDTLF